MSYPHQKEGVEHSSYWPSGMDDDQLEEMMKFALGDGPMRFGPVRQEQSVSLQLMNASTHHISAFAQISAQWKFESHKKRTFTNSQILRFLRFTKYNVQKSYELMKRTDPRHFDLTTLDLESVLRKKILFPIPGLLTTEESRVFYMRPSRYSPKEMPTATVIDNLIYVMNNMMLQNLNGKRKKNIAFVANMNDWTMSNFSTDYCYKFMQGLQGRLFPAQVDLFLIVNPPSWFDKVWTIMKPMLTEKFRAKVHMIKESQLHEFFQPGFEILIPDEFESGGANTDDLVNDYITFQQHLEKAVGKVEALTEKRTQGPTSATTSTTNKKPFSGRFSIRSKKSFPRNSSVSPPPPSRKSLIRPTQTAAAVKAVKGH